MNMRMEGHQVAESLYEHKETWLPPGRTLLIRLVQVPGDNAAECAQPVALVKVRPQQFGND